MAYQSTSVSVLWIGHCECLLCCSSDANDAKVRSQGGENEELELIIARGDDFFSYKDDATLDPGYHQEVETGMCEEGKYSGVKIHLMGDQWLGSSESYSEAEVKANCCSSFDSHRVLQLLLKVKPG